MRILIVSALALAIVGEASAQPPGSPPGAPPGYDTSRPVELKGTISELDTTAAQAVVVLKTMAGDEWKVEIGPSERLRTLPGLSDSFVKGEALTIRGFVADADPRRAAARDLTWSDGRRALAPLGGPAGAAGGGQR